MQQLKRFGIDFDKAAANESAVYGVACAYALIEREISICLRPFNLSPAKFNALMVIKHKGNGKGLSQIDIGRSLIVTASNMTRLIDRLGKDGYIEKQSQGNDRRVNLIKITRKGSELLDKAWPGYRQKIYQLTSLLNKRELSQVNQAIVSWCAQLERLNRAI